MWISIFFSESGQSIVRNALEAASLAQAILHSHASRRRAAQRSRRQRETGRRGTAERPGKAAKGPGRGAVAQRAGRGETASRVKEHQPQAIRMPFSSQPSRPIPPQRRIATVTVPSHTVTARARPVEAAKRRQLPNLRESL
jgi:hypothetical protein